MVCAILKMTVLKNEVWLMISALQGCTVSPLIEMYNGAVEAIWCLKDELRVTKVDLDIYQKTFNELSDKLYS